MKVEFFLHNRHIGKELGNISNRIRRYIDNEISAYGITHMQAMIIRFLKHSGDAPVFQRDIEKEFDIRRSSVTSVLQLMEKNGFITRTSDETDARLKQINITEAGYNAGNTVFGVLRSTDEKLESVISEEEREQLFFILGKLEKCITELEEEERKDKK